MSTETNLLKDIKNLEWVKNSPPETIFILKEIYYLTNCLWTIEIFNNPETADWNYFYRGNKDLTNDTIKAIELIKMIKSGNVICNSDNVCGSPHNHYKILLSMIDNIKVS